MREITVTTRIDARPEEVWTVLADTARYGEWNPFVTRIDSELSVGERIEVRLEPENWKPMTMKPRVLVADEGRELRWLGRLGLPGIFDGEHSFTIAPDGDGVSFTHAERFSGMLVALMSKRLSQSSDLARSFASMNAALARRVRRLRAQPDVA